MIQGHRWQKSHGNSHLVTRWRKSLTIPIATEHHGVEYRHSYIYYIADINLKIGWGTNTSHAEHGQHLTDQ